MTRLKRRGASCASSKSDIVFAGERSLRGLAGHDAELLRKYHLPDVARKKYGPICWSPHYKCTEKGCWQSLSIVPCGLSRSYKWDFLVLLIPSLVKWASSVYRMLRIVWRLASIERQGSSRLPMSSVSGCWMHWIWQEYSYKRSVRNVHRIFLRGTLRRAEFLWVLVRILTTAPMFSSLSRFQFTYLNLSTEFCALKGAPFSPVVLTTSEYVSRRFVV